MDFLKNKKLFLFDMDGTIYLGDKLFPGVKDVLWQIKEKGGKYLFLTNNSSKSVENYVQKLASMGIDTTREDFLTSAQATILYLKKHFPQKKIYALGTNAFKAELIKSGLIITDKIEPDISCLVMGFDTELSFKKLEDASILLLKDIGYVATNPDLVCPTEWGSVPDNGSVQIMLRNATGKSPVNIGKPEPEMVYLALKKANVSQDKAILIGDRLYTDIACGTAAGVDTALVLSGETKKQHLKNSIAAPTFVYESVREMFNV